MFDHTIKNTVPFHKRNLDIKYGYTEVQSRRDGPDGILISLEDVWQNATGKQRYYSRTIHAHLERKEALELAQSIITRYADQPTIKDPH